MFPFVYTPCSCYQLNTQVSFIYDTVWITLLPLALHCSRAHCSQSAKDGIIYNTHVHYFVLLKIFVVKYSKWDIKRRKVMLKHILCATALTFMWMKYKQVRFHGLVLGSTLLNCRSHVNIHQRHSPITGHWCGPFSFSCIVLLPSYSFPAALSSSLPPQERSKNRIPKISSCCSCTGPTHNGMQSNSSYNYSFSVN